MTKEFYGEDPAQFGELSVPAEHVEPLPVVVLIHGGFWRDAFDLSLMTPLAEDLVARGYAVWNLEYRRVGSGGGWPHTFEDVAAGIDHLVELAALHRLNLERVAVVGHSAGGHLALWAAGRSGFVDGQRWSAPSLRPVLAVGQAPVIDLELAARENAGTSGSVVQDFLGGDPDVVPDRYRLATPRFADEVEVVIVHGTTDVHVLMPWARLGPEYPTRFVEVPGADHFDVIDPNHPSWDIVVDALAAGLSSER